MKFRKITSSNYDLSNSCNLTCEGCYYFVSNQRTEQKRPSQEAYENFFAAEKARGVDYPQFSGGEPSGNLAALRIAAKLWEHGIVYTNGIRRLPDDLPFRIAISIWGNRENNDRLRGGNAYDQAFASAIGDPRALIYYTINRDNISDIAEVVEDCHRHDLRIAFNTFSVTTEYRRILDSGEPIDNPFVKFSTQDDNLALRHEDRLAAADLIDAMIDLYPETVLYSRFLNDWTHRTPAIHQIDPATGLATDCAYLNVQSHHGYDYNLERLKGKPCCAPEFDCADCRIGPAVTWTLLQKLGAEMRHSATARDRLRQLREEMMRFYFWDWAAADNQKAPT